jgi:hypothetical protein
VGIIVCLAFFPFRTEAQQPMQQAEKQAPNYKSWWLEKDGDYGLMVYDLNGTCLYVATKGTTAMSMWGMPKKDLPPGKGCQ